ncbi:hypothetical protein SanaruYs_06160 [Chryseotalea sanaruensis]|uniref:Glycosidase n=1 Tax=Chryseotalea sanaruensis TaxID=2482724 RepID=A0A401U646_9BACT|nr:hypothetical protein [Chryseotalea sanaruensis]GCC50401.1 hypothetical protein SanaruYs_06160 [Chryseotalea sanaruensis]
MLLAKRKGAILRKRKTRNGDLIVNYDIHPSHPSAKLPSLNFIKEKSISRFISRKIFQVRTIKNIRLGNSLAHIKIGIEKYLHSPFNDLVRKLTKWKLAESPSANSEIVFRRAIENPILRPKVNNRWESNAVFNAATVYLGNKVHFIYRAIGESGLSVFGYASSKDGLRIDKRSDVPAFICEKLYQRGIKDYTSTKPKTYPYASGGSWWGSEDPRLTVIDDTVYMTYTAFDGSNPPCVALSKISVSNFIKNNWNWTKPILISEPGKINKNWVIFPEKIKGKFALLHSITPNVSIAYRNSLEFEHGDYVSSYYQSKGREVHWDNWVRGAGPPPIKVGENWLLLYHAMDKHDPDRYKIGGMILDGKNPEKILYRSNKPLLEPDMWYENNGYKRGVVYTCGTVVIKHKLFLYYGASDSCVCMARADINHLIKGIMKGKSVLLQTPRQKSLTKTYHGTIPSH